VVHYGSFTEPLWTVAERYGTFVTEIASFISYAGIGRLLALPVG